MEKKKTERQFLNDIEDSVNLLQLNTFGLFSLEKARIIIYLQNDVLALHHTL